ncbi:Galactitol utilization operon repressor [Klebsiella michiganensis]|uniref:Galactitol utilization operon repressor n=1 Tax=Klebsiella michiganensis TaxID=1134687 RepID=A0A7H4PHA9_9ENTR|nr:Galactitol utilization operon repressor [Klebsiella michiganensis]
MNSFERRNKIVEMVNTQGSVLVLDLSNLFGISEVTIRADLRLLEEKGLLTRFHGGAARPGSNLTEGDNLEVVLEDRYQLASDPKKRIAQAAAAMISEGMTVILDSGSTTLLIAEALVRMTNITVITNSLPAAFTLSENKDITPGGLRRHRTPQNTLHARHHRRTFTPGHQRRSDVRRRRRHRYHQRHHHLQRRLLHQRRHGRRGT